MIHIVTAVHNRLQFTKTLIKSIKAQSFTDYTLTVVDDGSTDGTWEYLQTVPSITKLKGNGNLWWTGSLELAVNHVLKTALMSDYLLTINNDCVIPSNYLSQILQTTKTNKQSIIGSLVLDIADKSIVDAGVLVNWTKATFIPLQQITVKLRQVDVLSTKGTLFPIKVFYQIGNFDSKKFPHYLSDYAFTHHAKKNGFKLIMDHHNVVYNYSQETGLDLSNTTTSYPRRNLDLLFSRKSKINIIDQWRFFSLYCPPQYLLVCYFSLLKKITFHIFQTLRNP